ncbi:MAG TPA: diacylglycerol kinase family protein [Solirubrobacteraceae bacterium]|nr:diacylglycerol kinase family protein [Solirubrobacteraceae bacterium]
MRPLCLIVNPNAGGGRAARHLPRAEAALRARGFAFRVERTTSMEHARELAQGALAAGEAPVAMGGDGLTGAVAGEIQGTDGVLGILPGGRGNDFARKLGIPFEPEPACDVLAAWKERAVDVAMAGGRAYLGIASAGFDSDANEVANSTRLPLGRAVYVYATLAALRRWRDAAWHVEVDGTPHDFTGYSVAVANSGVFGGGMQLVPHASLDDGQLDVLLTRASPKPRFLRNLPRVFKGTHVREPSLVFLRGREIRFHADRPFTVYADGDPIAELPVTIDVRPHALKVLAP